MKKFLSGIITGIAVALLSLFLVVPRHEFIEAYLATIHGGLTGKSYGYIGPQYAFSVGEPHLDSVERHQARNIRLLQETPVLSFDASDYSRVCMTPSWVKRGDYFGSLSVHIYLTPQARGRLGTFLQTKPDTQFSFEFQGQRLSVLLSNTEMVEAYLNQRDVDEIDGDIWFDVPYGALVRGVFLAHDIAGSVATETCNGRSLADEIPAYESMIELYMAARSES